MTDAVDNAITAFQSALDSILATADLKLRQSKDDFVSKMDSVIQEISDYLADQKIYTVLQSSDLYGAINEVFDAASTIADSAMQEANTLASQSLTNVETDYSSGMTDAINAFNDDIQAITNWTQAMSDKLEGASDTLSEKMTTANDALSEIASSTMDAINAKSETSNDKINQLLDDFSNKRPILQLTGFVQMPPALILGETNKFRIGARNVGGADWYGWIGLKMVFTDDDGSETVFTANLPPNSWPHVNANESGVIPVEVLLPAGVEEDMALEMKMIINTRSWDDTD